MSIDDIRREQEEVRRLEQICKPINEISNRFKADGIYQIYNLVKNILNNKGVEVKLASNYVYPGYSYAVNTRYYNKHIEYESTATSIDIEFPGSNKLNIAIQAFKDCCVSGGKLTWGKNPNSDGNSWLAFNTIQSLSFPIIIHDHNTYYSEMHGFFWRGVEDNQRIAQAVIAYLSGEKVLRDFNPKQEIQKSRCFIASAVYGTSSLEVKTLRKLKDDILLTNTLGKNLVNFYYNISPPIANYIENHKIVRHFVKCLLVPIIFSAKFLLYQRGNKNR